MLLCQVKVIGSACALGLFNKQHNA